MIILLVLAAAVVGAPMVAAVLVSLASRREDARHSLAGKAPNWVTSVARRLLSVPSSEADRGEIPLVPRPRAPQDEDEDTSRWLTGRPA
jgi:hypothetical protein